VGTLAPAGKFFSLHHPLSRDQFAFFSHRGRALPLLGLSLNEGRFFLFLFLQLGAVLLSIVVLGFSFFHGIPL